VLKFLVSEYLLKKYPKLQEGDLTKIRAQVVSDSMLAIIAKKLNIGPFIRLSSSELKTQGQDKPSILSDTFEAIIGAYYLDQGMEKTRLFVLSVYEQFNLIDQALHMSPDFKSQVQEKLQKMNIGVPKYGLVREEGPDHQKAFYMQIQFPYQDQSIRFEGKGYSKKEAEQDAAKKAFRYLSQGDL